MLILAISLQGNIWHAEQPVPLSVVVYKIFLLEQFSRKIGFSSPVAVIVLFSIDGGFFSNLFELLWNVNFCAVPYFIFHTHNKN